MVSARLASEVTTRDEEVARWYAIYTNARHEKIVATQLEQRHIETFLPLYRSWRRWKDRRKLIDLALFPSYVFVKIPIQDRFRVLHLRGVVNLVSFKGRFAALPEHEINSLRNALEKQVYAEPYPYLKVGRRVRVVRGPMTGAEGILVRKKDKCRVVISIDVLKRSVAVEVDGADLEVIGRYQPAPRKPGTAQLTTVFLF